MSIMTTRSSVRVVRQPMMPATPSNLQAISGLRRLSEQPEDFQSINTVDAEDLGHGRDQGRRTPPPGGPPGNGPPDDDPDDDNNNPLDNAPNVDDNIDSDELIKKVFKCPAQPPAADTGSRAKVREPEVYDGTDQAKLRTFFLQCMLNFRDCPSAFKTGATKIQYAISYLSGPALQYFEPAILGKIYLEPTWLSNWDDFRAELEMNFGPFNNAAQAEIELEKIVMKDHHRAVCYFIDFTRASTRTQWNDATLAHAAYKGLPKHIKDSLLNFPRFKSLAELRNFTLEIDSRYWERKEYENLTNPTRGSNTSSNQSNPSNQSNQSSNSSNNNNNQKSRKGTNNTNNNNNNGNQKSSNNAKTPDLLSKLGKDGKLLPEECQRCINQGLCLLCGSKGHMVKECPKSKSTNSSNPKARAAKTSSDTKAEDSTATESKK